MKFRKKPVIVEATQWFKQGDHPDVTVFPSEGKYGSFGGCGVCGRGEGFHGRIETLEGPHIVCAGDWVITGVHNEKYPCKPAIFEKTYEKVEE